MRLAAGNRKTDETTDCETPLRLPRAALRAAQALCSEGGLKLSVKSVGNARTLSPTIHNVDRPPEASSPVLARNNEVRAPAFGVLGLAF